MVRGDTVYGTPSYMSPERVSGDPGDARSDLYSLGVLLYQLVSGRLPFPSRDVQAVLAAHQRREPPTLTTASGPPPAPVARVVARALRKSPDERYASAAAMIVDLEAALAASTRTSWRRWLS
jgi:serine/threonine protein kinase